MVYLKQEVMIMSVKSVVKKTEAKKLWGELRESISKKPSPFEGMSEEEVIKQLRKTRKKLWEKKLALRP
jgi:ATP sulfurylase